MLQIDITNKFQVNMISLIQLSCVLWTGTNYNLLFQFIRLSWILLAALSLLWLFNGPVQQCSIPVSCILKLYFLIWDSRSQKYWDSELKHLSAKTYRIRMAELVYNGLLISEMLSGSLNTDWKFVYKPLNLMLLFRSLFKNKIESYQKTTLETMDSK